MAKVSIITINYNNKDGLEATILSVLKQTCKEIEFIVIDGGSSDGSEQLIQKYSENITYWVSEKDKGIFHAQNKGAKIARGAYLLFLNSGDELATKHVIEDFIPRLNQHQLIFGDLIVKKNNLLESIEMPDKPDVYYFMVSSLAHPSGFIANTLFQQLNGYKEGFKIAGDYEFFIRAILINNATYQHYPIPLAVFNSDGASSIPENRELQREERKLSWQLNFTPPVVEAFEAYTQVMRSGELKVGKMIKKIFKPFNR